MIFYQDFRCILVKFQMYGARNNTQKLQKTTVMPSMKLNDANYWTEYRLISMFSETRFNILFRNASARYSDVLIGHTVSIAKNINFMK